MKKNLLALPLALLALLLAGYLSPPVEEDTALGKLRFQITPALQGGGDLYVPLADWGIRFPLHDSPWVAKGEVRSVDRPGALYAASGDDAFLRSAERDVYSGVSRALIRTFLLAVLIALLLSFFVVRIYPSLGRRFFWRSATCTSLLGVSLLILALLTHSPSALGKPSFYAKGEELGQILEAFSKDGASGSYQNNFRKVLADISAFLADRPAPRGDTPFVLASDLHSNALALPALRSFAESKPLLLAGDFGLEGNDAEAALLAPEIASLSRRVISVSGNHDSEVLMKELAKSGVVVLGRRGVLTPSGTWKSGGVRVSGFFLRGWDDPLEWSGQPGDPSRPYSLDSEEAKRESKELLLWWNRLRKKPDILLIHQPFLAESLAEKLKNYPRPLTIVVGHDHKQWAARRNNVLLLDAGSVGAGGIFGFGRETADMAEIHFSAVSRKAQTVDMIRVSPLDGRASAERVPLGDLCDLPCRYRPEGIG